MYVIYNIKTTRFARILRDGYWQDATYATEAAAKRAFKRVRDTETRLTISPDEYAIAEAKHFHANIEKQETKTNLMSGKEFTQPVNTPLCCDPSSETYWSM